MREALTFIVYAIGATSAIFVPDWNDLMGSFDDDIEDSSEHLGTAVAQVNQHPYAASLLLNNSYICSAVVLNKYWVLTLSKCFNQNQSTSLSSYITHNNLSNFSIRVGSSYNNKGGYVHKIKLVSNHFDLHVSAVRVDSPMMFSSQVQAVNLPNANANDEVSLGFLASVIAWTPSNHMRTVNMPLIDSGVCDRITKMMPGNYVCLAGVQDPNRHFCRRDNGGAVIQNNTLIAISSFINTCAQYSKTHAFPKTASFSNWLDSIIWDEDNRPTTTELPTTSKPTTFKAQSNASEANVATSIVHYSEPNIYMLTLPFDPINVPLEPSENNSVLPGMSLYESYIQSMLKARHVTTVKPPVQETKSTSVPNVEQPKNMYRKNPIRYNFNYN